MGAVKELTHRISAGIEFAQGSVDSTRMTQELITVLVAYAAIVSGAGLVIYCVMMLLSWWPVRRWPVTQGELVGARLRKGVRYTKPAPLDFYIPEVAYTYRADGRQYEGQRITVRDRRLASVDEAEAQAVLDAIEREPQVYYKSSYPARSVLVNRIEWQHWNFLITYTLIGLLMTAAGTLILSAQ